jgi:hypothetical protein
MAKPLTLLALRGRRDDAIKGSTGFDKLIGKDGSDKINAKDGEKDRSINGGGDRL